MDPQLPGHVANPGGLFLAWCDVQPDGTTPENLRIRIFDGSDQTVFDIEYPGSTYYYLYWNVPAGLDDGIYHYQVDYTSVEGPSATIRDGFLVAGLTRGYCAFKYIDLDGDGTFDEDTESLAEGWEICITGPLNDCKFTDDSGAACWFFIPAGEYQACETQQGGYQPTTPACDEFTIVSNIEKTLFGNAPNGACCLPPVDPCGASPCIITTAFDCANQDGQYYGDGTGCDPSPCSPPPCGACCLPTGDCTYGTPADCENQGGQFQGQGTDCDTVVCPLPQGACCLVTGECIVTTLADCDDQGGQYQGNGTDCDSIECPPPVPTDEATWGSIKNRYR